MISFRTIVESGLSKTDVYQKRRSILLSNYIALILCIAIILLGTIRFLFFRNVDQALFTTYFQGLILFSFAIVLNRLHLTTLSRLYLCMLPTAYVWYIFITTVMVSSKIETSIYDSLRIFILALSCIPYLILDKKQTLVFVLGILPSLISIFFFEFLLGLSGLDHASKGIPDNDYQYLQMRTIVSYLIVNSCCIVFQIIIQKSDEFNQRLLAELKEKSDEITSQNEELVQSEENLNKINQHLEKLVEERTTKIQAQNEVLIKYSYANAHHLRGPVARLLGLVSICKLETNPDYNFFIDKMFDQVHEIDAVVRQINLELESIH